MSERDRGRYDDDDFYATRDDELDYYDPEDEDEEEGRGAPVLLILAALVLIAFVASVWFAYQQGVQHGRAQGGGDTPTLANTSEGEKIRPEDPGGPARPDESPVYSGDEGGGDAALGPEAEQPRQPSVETDDRGSAVVPEDADIRGPTTDTPGGTAGRTPGNTTGPTQPPARSTPSDSTAPGSGARVPPPPPSGGSDSGNTNDGPTRVTPPRPPGSSGTPAGDARPSVPRPPTSSGGGNSGSGETAGPPSPGTANPPSTRPTPRPDSARPTPPTSGTTGTTSGNWVVQTSAVTSQADADRAFERLSARLPDLMGNRSKDIQIADVRGTTYYRVRIGYFPTRDAAATFCSNLKGRGQDCIVRER